MKSGRALFAFSLGIISSGFMAGEAFAHAKLMSSMPAKDAEGASPADIVLTFSEPITPAVVTLSDQEGHDVKTIGTPRADTNTLHLPVTGKLAPGHYTVTYRIAGADTHVVNGTLTFVVAAPR
jgi:methionine-rich copper-binding protein CopC